MIKEYYLKDGSKRYMYSGYYGINPATGKKIITKKRGFERKKDAELAEAKFKLLVNDSEQVNQSYANSKITFGEFYHDVWLPAYVNGQTSNRSKPPTQPTVEGTKIIFNNHLLPMFGSQILTYLNSNKHIVIKKMTEKSNEYANFKTIRSYLISLFNYAEEFEYIKINKLEKSLLRIKSAKKNSLKERKSESDMALSIKELSEWLDAAKSDYKQGKLSLMDYTLFMTTFFLSDRKSESYALKWKHIDFKASHIQINSALDRDGNIKSTKGNKNTIFNIPKELSSVLVKWNNSTI